MSRFPMKPRDTEGDPDGDAGHVPMVLPFTEPNHPYRCTEFLQEDLSPRSRKGRD